MNETPGQFAASIPVGRDPAGKPADDIIMRVEREETAHLAATARLDAITQPFWALVAIICVTGQFYGTPVPWVKIAIWLVVMTLGTLANLTSVSWLRRTEAQPGSRRHTAICWAVGFSVTGHWAAFSWICWSDDPLNQVSIMMLVLAVAAVSVARQVTQPGINQAAMLALIVVPSARFLTSGDLSAMVLGGGVLVLYPWLAISTGRLITFHRKSQYVRYENEALVQDLAGARDEAVAARIRAEHANRAKSDFLSHMSHELRTPLNSVIGFSELLQSGIAGELSERQLDHVGDINESGRHLLSLINDVLDLSKVEAGMVELDLEEVDLDEVIDGALRMVEVRARRANISLVRTPKYTDAIVWADRLRLKQILLNLLSNAVKFSHDNGRVTVETTLGEGGGARIDVVDEGVGMRPEDVPRALEAFHQLESTPERKQQGTGLGLPLTRQLVELHGGVFRLESALGKGTRAVVEMPGIPQTQSV